MLHITIFFFSLFSQLMVETIPSGEKRIPDGTINLDKATVFIFQLTIVRMKRIDDEIEVKFCYLSFRKLLHCAPLLNVSYDDKLFSGSISF